MYPVLNVDIAISKMVDDILAASLAYDRHHGQAEGEMSGQFLSAFVAGAVTKVIKPTDLLLTKEEQHALAVQRYKQMKSVIQDAVASGFDAAMTAYTRQPMHYYCQVKPTPESANKQPC